MQLTELVKNIQFKGTPDDRDVSNITYDSRKVKRGTLFVAIKGLHNDGHDYILDAIDRGAIAILSNGRSITGLDVPVIQVDDPRECMSRVAANFYRHPSREMNIVGITGTNGKTSVTQLVNAILKENNVRSGSLGTLGFITPSGMHSTGFTTPESIEIQQLLGTLKSGGIHHLVMEISSHALAMHRVDDVDVDIAVYTNLSPEHLDFHGDMEHYFAEKLKLFTGLKEKNNAIVNLDDEYAGRILQETPAKCMTYGFNPTADLYPVNCEFTLNGIQADLLCETEVIQIQSGLIGEFNLQNIMAAVATGIRLDIPGKVIESAINHFKCVPGRLEMISNSTGGQVIVDYAHTPDAYEKVLSMVRELSSQDKKIFTLFGCGGDRDSSKRPIMGRIAETYSDFVFVTSDNPRTENVRDICDDIRSGFEQEHHQIIYKREEALHAALARMDAETILMILGKGRENYEIIGTEKIYHNDIAIVENYRK